MFRAVKPLVYVLFPTRWTFDALLLPRPASPSRRSQVGLRDTSRFNLLPSCEPRPIAR